MFAMASLSLGQDRYDFSLSARATGAFLCRLCQCACFQVGCLRKTDGTRDKGERKSHGEGEEQLMLLGATRSTRLRGSCAPSATSMMRSRWGSKAKRCRWYLIPHLLPTPPPCYSVAAVFSIWLAPTANEVSSVPFASLRESMARALRRAVKTAT